LTVIKNLIKRININRSEPTHGIFDIEKYERARRIEHIQS